MRPTKDEMKEKHPDVLFYCSYDNNEERLHLRITTLETDWFRHGLGLDLSFVGEDKWEVAHQWAIRVQEYLDKLVEFKSDERLAKHDAYWLDRYERLDRGEG